MNQNETSVRKIGPNMYGINPEVLFEDPSMPGGSPDAARIIYLEQESCCKINLCQIMGIILIVTLATGGIICCLKFKPSLVKFIVPTSILITVIVICIILRVWECYANCMPNGFNYDSKQPNPQELNQEKDSVYKGPARFIGGDSSDHREDFLNEMDKRMRDARKK